MSSGYPPTDPYDAGALYQMAGAVPPEMTPETEPTVINTDVPCRKCRYNLRGLSTDGRCPECGTPVGYSIKGDLIRFSDPAWVDLLGRGIRFIMTGVAVFMIGIILMVALTMAHLIDNRTEAAVMTVIAMLGGYVLMVVGLGGYVLMVVGTWFLTAPDPSGLGEDKYGTARQLIRIALIVGVGRQIVDLMSLLNTVPPDVHSLMAVVEGLASIVGVVGQFALLNYLSKLAGRLPDYELANRASFLMYALGISLGLFVLIGLVTAAIGASNPTMVRSVFPVIGCIGGIVGLALIVFGLMYLRMLSNFGKRFKFSAEIARRSWAVAAPPSV